MFINFVLYFYRLLDSILHDGAPNVGVSWLHDAYSQTELVLMSLKIVAEFLTYNGLI